MAETGRDEDAERLRYVADMLGQLARLLPAPGRSTLAYFVEMARLQAEAELGRGKDGGRQRGGTL